VVDRGPESLTAQRVVVPCFKFRLSVGSIGSFPAAIVKTVLPAGLRILEARNVAKLLHWIVAVLDRLSISLSMKSHGKTKASAC